MTRAGAGGMMLLVAMLVASCGQDDKPAPTSAAPPPTAGAGDPARGRQVWLAECVACHNTDPAKAGPVGPAVRGASRDLLTARLEKASYPPGYAPKRDSKAMPARPDLLPSVPDLAAYLR